MDSATLDGMPGAGEVRIRRRSDTEREYRGVFAFRKEHEAALVEILALGAAVEYEGVIEGRRRRLKVRLADMAPARGMVAFQGLGEPYDESEEERVS